MKPLIVALDVDTDKEAIALAKATSRWVDIVKVGPPLLLRYGPPILSKLRKLNKKIFLDLKFHDIPNTMLRSIKDAARNGIFSATVHTSAGETALRTVADIPRRPQLWGVTILTSLGSNDLRALGFVHSSLDQTRHLALMAKKCGLDGVVASVGETAQLRSELGPSFTIVTPGIRLPDGEAGDQVRIATPQHAREAGATYMVVGRPIIEAKDPAKAAELMARDWNKK